MEITQNPSVWQRWAQSETAAQIRVGFEAELIVPVPEASQDAEPEPDYTDNPPAMDIDDVVEFYSSTEHGLSTREANQLRAAMETDYAEYVEEKVDDAFDEYGYSMVRTLAQDYEGLDADEIDDVMDAQSDKYHELADQVRDQLRTRAQSENDQRDWLRHKGIRYMRDVMSEYNVTWPIWEVPNHSSQDTQVVADNIAHTLEVRVLLYSAYHTAPRVAHAWVLEPDSSIIVHDEDSQAGLELITPSPPPALPESLQYMDKVFTWAKSYGCETNRTTGFHMNMSLPPEIHVNLDPVKLILLLGDQKILSDFGRSANTYAQSAFDTIQDHIKTTDQFPVDKALEALRLGLNRMAAQIMQKPFMGKYMSVNVKPQYVEFRHVGGDYLDKLPEIKLTMLRMAYTLHVASDETQAKSDYARKLYSLLSGFARGTRMDHVINMFSLHSAGIINTSVLKNSLKQTPTATPPVT